MLSCVVINFVSRIIILEWFDTAVEFTAFSNFNIKIKNEHSRSTNNTRLHVLDTRIKIEYYERLIVIFILRHSKSAT